MSDLEHLTRIYQAIFGADILKAVIGYRGDFHKFGERGDMPTRGMVILEFRNGRRVELWASEWGGVLDAERKLPDVA